MKSLKNLLIYYTEKIIIKYCKTKSHEVNNAIQETQEFTHSQQIVYI